MTLADIVRTAYEADSVQTAFLTSLPSNKLYDHVSNLPERSGRPLQELLRKQFGLTGHWEILETNVLVLKDSNPDNPGLKPAKASCTVWTLPTWVYTTASRVANGKSLGVGVH